MSGGEIMLELIAVAAVTVSAFTAGYWHGRLKAEYGDSDGDA